MMFFIVSFTSDTFLCLSYFPFSPATYSIPILGHKSSVPNWACSQMVLRCPFPSRMGKTFMNSSAAISSLPSAISKLSTILWIFCAPRNA